MFEDFVEESLIDDVFKTSVVDSFAGHYPGCSDESDEKRFMESGKEDDCGIIRDDINEKISGDGIEEQYPEMTAASQGLRAEIDHKQGRDKYEFAEK